MQYDKDNPPLVVDTTYPNLVEFKFALSQHAIKYEFEYNIEKSAPYRFTSYCSMEEKDKYLCRLHVLAMEDMSVVMVIVVPNCLSSIFNCIISTNLIIIGEKQTPCD